MKHAVMSLFLAACALAPACDSGDVDGKAAEAKTGAKAEAAKTDAEAEAAPKTEPADAKAPGGADAKAPAGGDGDPPDWKIVIDGKLDTAGSNVMNQHIGPLTKYLLLGGDAVINIDLQGEGKDPHFVQIIPTATKEHCTYGAGNHGESRGITVKLEGDRYEISGEITCEARKSDPPQREVARISGWFPKEKDK